MTDILDTVHLKLKKNYYFLWGFAFIFR